jgi:DNA mismatch repair protein MutS
MRQYLEVKDRYPDAIVFFRLGDFYEMFFEDAEVAAKLLDLTLTTRDKGKEDAVPMCGVPHHAARGYVARLCELGRKVVICDQVEDPRLAKGIVKREVVRVVTPGTVLDQDCLDAKAAHYLAAVTVGDKGRRGLAYLDITTGDFHATEVDSDAALADEIARVAPREILAARADLEGDAAALAPLCKAFPSTAFSPVDGLPEAEARDLVVGALSQSLSDVGLAELPLATGAAAAALAYARATQPTGALPICRLVVYRTGDTLVLCEATQTHLELTETWVGRKKAGSLLSILDDTRTAPGGRLLRRWLLFPLVEVAEIRRRQDAVECLVERAALRAELRARMAEIHDLERLVGRVKLGVATPRDVLALRRSLEVLPGIAALVDAELSRMLAPPTLLSWDPVGLGELGALAADVAATLADDPPAQLKDGGVVRVGHSPEIDALRRLEAGSKDEILRIEARERERTGISSLKVRYNRVFGYYLEITRANLRAVPADYVRKQTLANAERYVTPELGELESRVLEAEEKRGALEAEIFAALVARVAKSAPRVLFAAMEVARLDVLCSLAEVAHRSSYVRPLVREDSGIDIEEGRHPVVERLAASGSFVPNDCRLDPAAEQLLVITGPNMAGKSTYMRQVAHIVLCAQMGAFVPARRATIGVVDRIFTRVGAADNLAQGESTFMVEMRETSHILRHATRRSLVLLDEIGRGTSTYDGISIAWSVAEYLHDAVGAMTLFATHYHELCALARKRPRVRNVAVAVREHRGEVIFLRKIVAGAAEKSYGIEVARLAGLPRSVVSRARQILADLERPDTLFGQESPQLSLLPPSRGPVPAPVEAALAELDPNRLTPLEALVALADLKRLVTPQ